jgi:hypothetical protein
MYTAIAAPFPAGESFLLPFFRLPNGDSHSSIRDRVCVEKQGKPGETLLIIGKAQAARQAGGCMFLVFFHFLFFGTYSQIAPDKRG